MWFVDKRFGRREGGTCSGETAKSVNPGAICRAFTLVELLVAMVLMIIVAGAALIYFRTTAENETRQQENLEQLQNLRAAFNTVIRDARMAGNGLAILGTPLIQVYVPATDPSGAQEASGWFKYKGVDRYGARAIYGTDSGSDLNKSDTLTIFRSDIEVVNPIGRLGAAYTPFTDSSLTLKESVTEGKDLASGDIIALSTGTVAIILQAKLSGATSTLTIDDRFKPGEALKEPAGYSFPAGTVVYNLKDVSFVTYYLDNDNLRLMANYHDMLKDGVTLNTATVASNIEDFQVNYYVAPPTTPDPAPVTSLTWADLSPNGNNWVNAVRIGMVSRSATSRNQGSGQPVDLMGHKASEATGFARRIMVENIQLRNF